MTPVLHRVAVIKPCCIGDCVMALPAISVLRGALPDARIDVFAGTHSSAIFTGQPEIDAVHTIPDQPSARASLRLGLGLRGFSTVALLDRSRYLRVGLMLSQASERAFAEAREPEMRHESRVYLDVVATLGYPVPTDPPLPHLAPIPMVAKHVRALVDPALGRYVVLHPGGAANPGTTMLEKRWPVERFTQLATTLADRGFTIVLSGGPGDVDLAETIRAEIDGAVSLVGKTDLRATAEVIRHADLFVGGDTGVSHIAAAVGTPVVTIFGPTNPARYRPLGERVTVLAPAASWEIEDRDLRTHTGAAARPSTSEVGIDEVLAACEGLLSERASL